MAGNLGGAYAKGSIEKGRDACPSERVYSEARRKFSERSGTLPVKMDNKSCNFFFAFTHANSRVSAIYL